MRNRAIAASFIASCTLLLTLIAHHVAAQAPVDPKGMNDMLRSGGAPAGPPPAAAPKAAPPGQAQTPTQAQTPPPPAPPAKGDIAEPYPGPAKPLDLDALGDDKRRAKAKIGPGGGSLTATGADGAVYELTIPAKALTEEVEIFMRPILSLDGLPVAGTKGYGAILEPDGLELAELAMLRISKPGLKADKNAFAVAGHAIGRDSRMTLAKFDGDTILIPVGHFSIYRAETHGGALARLRGTVANTVPRSQQDRFSHGVAHRAGGDRSLTDGFLRDYWRQIEAARSASIGDMAASCGAVRNGMSAFMQAIKALRAVGLPSAVFTEAHRPSPQVLDFLKNMCRTEAEAECRARKDISSIQKQAIAECNAYGGPSSGVGEYACHSAATWSNEAIRRCVPTDLVIRTVGTGTYLDKGNCRQLLRFDVEIRFSLGMSAAQGVREGQGAHFVHSYTHSYPDCPCNPSGRDKMIPVDASSSSSYPARAKVTTTSAPGSASTTMLELDPGRILNRWRFRTCGGSEDTLESDQWWRDNFLAHYQDRVTAGWATFDLSVLGAGDAIRFEYQGSRPEPYGIWRGNERTTVTLRSAR